MFCSIFSSPDSDSQEKGHIHKVHLCLSVMDFIYLTVKPLLSSQSVPNFTPIAVKREILSVQAECGSLDQRTASESLYITLPKITHRVERKIIGKTHLALLSKGDDAQHLLFIGDPTWATPKLMIWVCIIKELLVIYITSGYQTSFTALLPVVKMMWLWLWDTCEVLEVVVCHLVGWCDFARKHYDGYFCIILDHAQRDVQGMLRCQEPH